MQLCERVWLYLCLATVQWCCCCFQPPSLNLVNQPGTPRTWRCNRCDSHDHLFDWYRQNKYASLVLNLIFLLLLKILHWWLLLIHWLQVNILFFLNRKKEHKILLYKKKSSRLYCLCLCVTLYNITFAKMFVSLWSGVFVYIYSIYMDIDSDISEHFLIWSALLLMLIKGNTTCDGKIIVTKINCTMYSCFTPPFVITFMTWGLNDWIGVYEWVKVLLYYFVVVFVDQVTFLLVSPASDANVLLCWLQLLRFLLFVCLFGLFVISWTFVTLWFMCGENMSAVIFVCMCVCSSQ